MEVLRVQSLLWRGKICRLARGNLRWVAVAPSLAVSLDRYRAGLVASIGVQEERRPIPPTANFLDHVGHHVDPQKQYQDR